MEREDARKLSPDAQREGRRQVVRAYKRGVKQRQIARELGWSYSSVRMILYPAVEAAKTCPTIDWKGVLSFQEVSPDG